MLKNDRNTKMSVATRKGYLVSSFTSRSTQIAMPSLEEIPEVPLVTRQDS